jgi:Mg-chelatase subunit ChlD
MFILDASGSIGSESFQSVRNFVLQYIGNLNIGPNDNQIGVITFSSAAQVVFRPDTYSDGASLRQAVRNIRYTDGATNIPDALCQLITLYSSNSSGARFDSNVFRVAILMTDGQSNENFNSCRFGTVAEAAAAVHAASPPIIVLAFGVGSRYDPRDVEGIASRPEYVTSALSFSTTQLDCVRARQENDICNRSKYNN